VEICAREMKLSIDLLTCLGLGFVYSSVWNGSLLNSVLWLNYFHQVLCAAKKKALDKFESALLQASRRVSLKEVDLGSKPPQITGNICSCPISGPQE
jgi:hypothetical protein